MLSVLHETDEAGTFAVAICALGLPGEIQHQIMIQPAQVVRAAQQKTKTHH